VVYQNASLFKSMVEVGLQERSLTRPPMLSLRDFFTWLSRTSVNSLAENMECLVANWYSRRDQYTKEALSRRGQEY